MRIMGLDLGTRTIGVAVSDETGFIARGVETIHRRSLEKDLQRLAELVQAEEVGQFVLGYPKNMNGTIGDRARASEEFKKSWRNASRPSRWYCGMNDCPLLLRKKY